MFFALLFLKAIAQKPVVLEISNKNSFCDSSYYEALVFNDHHVWFLGKHGVITQLKDSQITSIKYPSNGSNILSASQIDKNNYILTGDKGNIFFYDALNNNWTNIVLKDYKTASLYSVWVINEKEFMICGGNSKIARSEKAIPNGFILRTKDGGKNWKRVYRSIFNMAWRINSNPNGNQLFVNLYHLNKSSIISSSDSGKTWKKTKIKSKGIIHDFFISDEYTLMVGGPSIKKRKIAYAELNNVPLNLPEIGFIWDVNYTNNTLILSCGKSCLIYKNLNENEWKIIKLNETESKNIYKTVYVGNNTYYACGSGKKIYKITFE